MKADQKNDEIPEKNRGNELLACLKCGGDLDRVVSTTPQKRRAIMRRRECKQCKARFTTKEQIVGDRPDSTNISGGEFERIIGDFADSLRAAMHLPSIKPPIV